MIPAIQIKNLTKKFRGKKQLALDNVNLTVQQGDWHGFIGPNGAGKTTTIKTLIGAINPTKGNVKIFGHDAKSIKSKSYIGYIPENPTFEKGRSETTYKYLYEMGKMNGLSKVKTRLNIRKVVRELQIDPSLLKLNPDSFSSGQKRKILIAQALLHDPGLLILDEPTANLDPTARKFVLDLLKRFSIEKKITIFISSHVLSEIQKYVTGWTFINEGKILENNSLGLHKKEHHIHFEVASTSLKDLRSHLSKKGFKNIQKSKRHESLIVTLDNSKDQEKLKAAVLGSPFVITTFKKKIVDLEELYQELRAKVTSE